MEVIVLGLSDGKLQVRKHDLSFPATEKGCVQMGKKLAKSFPAIHLMGSSSLDFADEEGRNPDIDYGTLVANAYVEAGGKMA